MKELTPKNEVSENAYTVCDHCGTPFSTASRKNSEFCCNGCEYVHKLIKSEGWDHYYTLRDGRIDPVKSAAFRKRDFTWLKTISAEAEAQAIGSAEAVFDIEGISCIGCVWLIEKSFNQMPGSERIEINTQYGQMKLVWSPGIFDPSAFAGNIQKFGYSIGPAGDRPQIESRNLINRIGLSGAFALNAMLFTLPRYLGMKEDFVLAGLFELLTLLFASLSLIFCGNYFIGRGLRGIKQGILHIDFPIALGLIAAYLGSVFGWFSGNDRFLYFDFVAIFIFLMLCGRWIQERTLEANRNKLMSHSKTPSHVVLVEEDLSDGEKLQIDSITSGVRFRVLPGEIIPVFSELESINAGISLEWINGESEMHTAVQGSYIPSGALNIGVEPILLKSRQPYSESTLKRLLARESKTERDRFSEKILAFYLATIVLIAGAGSLSWILATENYTRALQVALSVLVVSCPCALGVSIPFAREYSILKLRKMGIFIRNALVFRKLSQINQIIFDKTGTLTLEAPKLINPEALALDKSNRAVLRRMVEESLHPVSRALKEELFSTEYRGANVPADLEIIESIGNGLMATSKSEAGTWKLGKAKWAAPETDSAEGTVFAKNDEQLASFQFEEELREGTKTLLKSLQKQYRVHILSGDTSTKVQKIADFLELEPECVEGEMSPEDKANRVNQGDSQKTLFIGDGANDALAFKASGLRGTPATPHGLLNEISDFHFTGRSLNGIRALLETAKSHRNATYAAFAFAVIYNIAAVSIALAGAMHPLLAAIMMPLSSVVTLLIVRGLLLASNETPHHPSA